MDKEEKVTTMKEKVKDVPVYNKEEITSVKEEKKNDGKEKSTDVKGNKKLEDYRTLGKSSKAQMSESAVKKSKSKDKKGEKKEVELERVYVVPMRRGFLKVPAYRRAKKAIKTLKEFLAKHMKVEDRNLSKVKIDIYLNNEIWFKGIKKPLSKVKVLAKKIDGIVYAELAEMPDIVRFKKQKDERMTTKVDKKKLNKVVTQEAAEEKVRAERSDTADEADTKEKEASTAEAGEKFNKERAKTERHTAKAKSTKMEMMSETTKRKILKR